MKYEKGLTLPGEEVIKKIANFGGITVEWLLRGEGPPAPPSLEEYRPEDYSAGLTALETALLAQVLIKVEEVLLNRRLLKQYPPERKARLVVKVYDSCRASHQPPSHYIVQREMLLVD